MSTPDVVSDLEAEYAATHRLLASLSPDQWLLSTPAPGWDVSSQVIHLGLFDRRAMWSIAEPERFVADRNQLMTRGGLAAIEDAERSRPPGDLLAWWQEGTEEILRVARRVDLAVKCEWYGPSMSAMSMLTARLMETWAHTHDIADSVGAEMAPTNRLRHVAHIGVRARPFAYAVNKMTMPDADVRVELCGPYGDIWVWGNDSSHNRVSGEALGFCRAVTQRRHVSDCGLQVTGDAAEEWMSIAQAFAGPPGVGREPGQFS